MKKHTDKQLRDAMKAVERQAKFLKSVNKLPQGVVIIRSAK